jgi:hypothetical protein
MVRRTSGFGWQVALLARRDRAAQIGDLYFEGHVWCMEPSSAPAEFDELGAVTVDQHVGPKATDVELRARRELGERPQARSRQQEDWVGVLQQLPDRGGIPGELGELAHREH